MYRDVFCSKVPGGGMLILLTATSRAEEVQGSLGVPRVQEVSRISRVEGVNPLGSRDQEARVIIWPPGPGQKGSLSPYLPHLHQQEEPPYAHTHPGS